MRPAQKAPENAAACRTEVPAPMGFNEAGAKSAGKQWVCSESLTPRKDASMRPAQKAPENADAPLA